MIHFKLYYYVFLIFFFSKINAQSLLNPEQEKIANTGTIFGTEFGKRNVYEGPRPLSKFLSPDQSVQAPANFRSSTRTI